MTEFLNNPTEDRARRDKAIRLVDFLTQVALLRSKVVRTVDEYQNVLWLNEVPMQTGCFTQAWGPNEDHDSDVWISVQGRREPELPTVPDLCENWVRIESLHNTSDLPQLLEEILVPSDDPDCNENSEQEQLVRDTMRLEDCPEVQESWNTYVESRWLPWMAAHNDWASMHKVYSQLFAIRQEQARLGEEYELVLGVGLLFWRTPSGQQIRRHLLVADTMLEFESGLGRFTLKPHPEGTKFRPEFDMMEIGERTAGAELRAREVLRDNANPWERGIVDGTLESLVNSLDSRGEYRDCLDVTGIEVLDRPVVVYAPALILRKRSAKGLTDTLQHIRELIENGESIPREFCDLAEIQPTNDEQANGDTSRTRSESSSEVFFPKLSNEEQRSIVDNIRTASGALVQGPPGTGKSHTIANLICHLLATGQRTLITAKTPRALKVLEELVPKELRSLCINLMGSGAEERRSLETSIGGILREYESWNENRSLHDRETLKEKLHQLRMEGTEVNRRLRDIRESETYSRSISQEFYQGKAATIAKAVNRDRPTYDWFKDDVRVDSSCPVSQGKFRRILDGLRHFTPERRHELSLELPHDLPSRQRWRDLLEKEARVKKEERTTALEADEHVGEVLSVENSAYVEGVRNTLTSFLDVRRRLTGLAHPWLEEAIRDAIAGNTATWREILRATRFAIVEIEPLAEVADHTDIKNPDNINVRTLHDVANELQCYLRENGGRLKFWRILPKSIVENRKLIKNLRVNGKHPSELQDFQDLQTALRTRIECEKAWGFWVGRAERSQTPYQLQVRELNRLSEVLEDALSLEELTNECREIIRRCPEISEPIWIEQSTVERISASCRLALVRQRRRECEDEIRTIENPVSSIATRNNAHPLASELIHAIRDRSLDRVDDVSNKIQSLSNAQKCVKRLDSDVLATRQHLPILFDVLEQTCNDPCWDERVNQIQDAWRWAYAKYWVEEFISQEDAPAISQRAKQIEDEINRTVAELAKQYAWSFCFSRLTENHRQHMVMWNQLMRRVGRGTGRNAPRYLREARKQLSQCHEAVPAWVMPLHRVWDTVDPAPGLFDVIIVDEASQCGIEAMPLFFLGKKLLIVGDDKQISPDAVGLNRDDVHGLMDNYLGDFQFRESFHVESSLFDYGSRRYAARRITLREHFRCMPEIIRFSNNLCYSDTPLIPLRQYGPNRLIPLERVFVSGGYREGTGNRAINRPEADAVVDKIVELCNDNTGRYEKKSMGVVVLQGEEQARLIETQLLERLGAREIEQRRLVCGNPYSFQGDERDIIFLSLVAATNAQIGPLTRPADERRFNVAASRAKDQMYLFHSVTRDDLSERCFRRRLLEFFENTEPPAIVGIDRDKLERLARVENRQIVNPPNPFESWFELDVGLEIARRGFNVIPQYEVANRRIDLVVEGGNARLAVECDGDAWHGPDEYEADMFRQRQLERCGWAFFRVRQSAFIHDKERALDGLWRALEERDIFPTSQ